MGLLLLVVAATALPSCGGEGFGSGSATTTARPAPTTTTTTALPTAADEVVVGEGQLTPAGNWLRVAEVHAGSRSAEAAVEACAAAGETVGVRVRADQFRLVLGDGHIVSGGAARRQPRLDEALHLRRGECRHGWVGFRMPTTARPVAVLFVARPDADESLRWKVAA